MLQGDVHAMCGDLDSKTLGTLTLKLSSTVKGNQPATMIIGHSLMEGRTDTLKKPLVAVRPAQGAPLVAADAQQQADQERSPGEGAKGFDMVAVIRRRIIFKNRPQPFFTNHAAAAKAAAEEHSAARANLVGAILDAGDANGACQKDAVAAKAVLAKAKARAHAEGASVLEARKKKLNKRKMPTTDSFFNLKRRDVDASSTTKKVTASEEPPVAAVTEAVK